MPANLPVLEEQIRLVIQMSPNREFAHLVNEIRVRVTGDVDGQKPNSAWLYMTRRNSLRDMERWLVGENSSPRSEAWWLNRPTNHDLLMTQLLNNLADITWVSAVNREKLIGHASRLVVIDHLRAQAKAVLLHYSVLFSPFKYPMTISSNTP